LAEVALAPWRLLTDPAERAWWPALLVAAAVALVLELRAGRRHALRRVAAVARHPSTLVDLQFLFVRSAVRLVVLAAVPAAATWLAVQVAIGLWAMVGAPTPGLAASTLVAGYSVTLFVLSDASRYLLHRVTHRVPVLWRFHQVHHSAEVLSPLTLYRIHPVEQVIQAGRGLLVVGAVAGLFAWLGHGRIGPLELFGVPAAVLALNVLGANLRHSNIALRYPRLVEHVLISPAQHQIHHGAAAEEHSHNLGAFLAVWDWAGGTLRCSDGQRPVRFGLIATDLNHDPGRLLSALLGPLRGR
jgi:sterol desaturase/sphingolipid hydroxylase (fatty acid hydroxylase superfamily)